MISTRGILAGSSSEPPKTYAKLDSAKMGSNLILSNGDLTLTHNATAAYNCILANIGKQISDGGRWYWEMRIDSINAADATDCPFILFGLANYDTVLNNFLGASNDGVALRQRGKGTNQSDCLYNGGSNAGNFFPTTDYMKAGDIIMFDLDLSLNTFKMGKNGDWGVAAVSTIVTPTTLANNYSGTPKKIYPAYCIQGGPNRIITLNFGASPFSYSPPSGANSGWYL